MSELIWRKSSKSANNGQCVEVAYTDRCVLVRDSKNPTGLRLYFTEAEWEAFLYGAKNGEFDI